MLCYVIHYNNHLKINFSRLSYDSKAYDLELRKTDDEKAI